MIENKKKLKIALFHPWLKSRGGAEQVILKLARELNAKIDIYTWIYDPDQTFEGFKKYKINIVAPKFTKKLSRLGILRGLFLIFSLFSKIPLEKYDLFLVSTSGVGEFITFRNYKKGKTYAYVHTPLREANQNIIKWNLENKYKNIFSKLFYLFAVSVYRFFEKISWKRINHVIFNSELSQSRARNSNLIKKQREYVVYPPIDFSTFNKLKNGKNGKYFLYYSRLNLPKRQDVLLNAWPHFVKMNPAYKLIIVGNVENKNYFEKLKKLQAQTKNVEIKTNVPNKEKENLLANSKGGIFLGYEEDFGIIPLEIIAAGKPLMAPNEGGYVRLIKGHPLFYELTEKHSNKEMSKEISKKLDEFTKKRFSFKKKEIKLKNFIEEMEKILK